MVAQAMPDPKDRLNLALWQAKANSTSRADFYARLKELGLPDEVVSRLYELISYTKQIGEEVFSIGKIIVGKIIDFAEAYPNLAAGTAVGIAVALLINSIPVIGQILAPVALALGIIAGNRLDRRYEGHEVQDGLMSYAEDVVDAARKFFQLLIDIFNAVFGEMQPEY